MTNIEVRKRASLMDSIRKITTLKHNGTGYVARVSVTRWTKRLLEWRPKQESYRNRRRSPTNWVLGTEHKSLQYLFQCTTSTGFEAPILMKKIIDFTQCFLCLLTLF